MFDPRTNAVILCNFRGEEYTDVETTVELFDLKGKLVFRRAYGTALLPPDAYGLQVAAVDFSQAGTDLVFLRLTLRDRAGNTLGENTYWHNRRDYQDYRGLNALPQAAVTLRAAGQEAVSGGRYRQTLELTNGDIPVLGLRLRLLDGDGAAVLPVFYSDNYLTLMPGQRRTVTAEWDPAGHPGEARWELSGWNLDASRAQITPIS